MRATTGSNGRELDDAPLRPGETKTAGGPGNVTCESTLRQIGVDEAFVAKKLKELLGAKQPRWNPKKKGYELFADNDARLAAIREVIKIFGGYPSEREGDEGTVIVDLGSLTPKEFRNGAHKQGHAVSRVSGVPSETSVNRARGE